VAVTKARIAKGTTLGIDAANGTSYTTVAELVELVPPEQTLKEVIATHLTSDNDHEEKIPGGFIDAGRIDFTCNYYSAELDIVNDIFQSRDTFTFKITVPDNIASPGTASTWTGAGFFNKVRPLSDVKPDATTPMRHMCSITISGKLTYTPAT
jgi:hypothetical protein